MSKYSPERKEAVVKKFFPPLSRSVTELVVEEGISAQTLYNWRNELNVDGYAMPLNGNKPEQWSSQAKFAVVVEVTPLSEVELSQYCREKGLLVEQVKEWRAACINGNLSETQRQRVEKNTAEKNKNALNS
jgi:transposase